MLKIRNLVKIYAGAGASAAVKGIDLDIAAGRFVTLLGPSGCGKTTTLRMIAGLEQPSGGDIEIDGRAVYSSSASIEIPANRRPIAMVFQSYAVWPHMDVFHNVSFPLEGGKFRLGKAEIKSRTEEALATVGLADFSKRLPSSLSGGQQQRVALARAIVTKPKILLLDEPLSNLDLRLRDQMRDMIKELHEAAHLTTIFVTHDQNEAMALSDEIVILNEGKIVETGAPDAIFQKPRDPFTANFIGKYNILDGRISAADGNAIITVETAGGTLRGRAGGETLAPGVDVRVYVRPGSFALHDASVAAVGLTGRIESTVYQGSFWEVRVKTRDGKTLLVHASLAAARRLDLRGHGDVTLVADPDEVVIVPNA